MRQSENSIHGKSREENTEGESVVIISNEDEGMNNP